VPEVRRLLVALVWTTPVRPGFVLAWSRWRRRHQARARRAHYHRRERQVRLEYYARAAGIRRTRLAIGLACAVMPSPTLDLRFGVVVNGQRSYTWHVRSGADKPELFVWTERTSHTRCISLHASGDWHMKVGRRAVHEWRRPAELTPGYTRALAIVQPVAVAMFALPAPPDAHILKLPADGQPTQFDLWIERLGANLQGWPGKNADGALVGRIPLG